ncbi:hypothetical protein QBC33DRAFT_459372 [Phialemonium atrogriseum]|uniref:SET domain-containing protein n=1 Tax=Phialemonium atrogriseum TaxID=1093897 RepID=A0AAJ0BU91_9PEZI|nr:uncharacterized protein QBC33DRAFT_459372 [Phialemonium atrogriseum]KAK1763503.1 hypothetical protein QBC33DRAFT_459372 [Phialemonium atrogriseum]
MASIIQRYWSSLLWLPLISVAAGGDDTCALRHSPASSIVPSLYAPNSAICTVPTVGSNRSVTDVPISEQSRWIQDTQCHGFEGVQFCAYTQSSLNEGESVSLITTPERFAKLASESAFRERVDDSSSQVLSESSLPYRDVAIPGKGIGLIATRPIRAGQRIMAHRPAVMVDGRAYPGMSKENLADLLARAVEPLPPVHRDRFLNLSTHDGANGYTDLVHKIFTTNTFRTSVNDGESDFYSTFTEVSRLNHDCQPNCGYYFDHTTLSLKVIAATDISPGEELSVSYIDVLQPRSKRQGYLHTHWGFHCSCKRCTADAHLAAESDSRIAQIHRLRAELDDYSDSSTATPAKAELLVLLFELEGAAGRMHEALYRAAIEWSGVGDAARAVKYARLCLDRGLRFRGQGRPFEESMRRLLEDPEVHWSWRSRLHAGREEG